MKCACSFFMVLYAAMQTACNPVIGALTDAYGRRFPTASKVQALRFRIPLVFESVS